MNHHPGCSHRGDSPCYFLHLLLLAKVDRWRTTNLRTSLGRGRSNQRDSLQCFVAAIVALNPRHSQVGLQ